MEMELFKNLRGFVFDFDGTLAILNIDFNDMRRDIMELARGFGLDVEPFRGMYVLEMVERAREALASAEQAKGERFFLEAQMLIQERELCAARCGGLHDGSLSLLLRLGKQGIRRGIITRNCEEAVRILFPDVDDYCEAFLPRNRVKNVKPHPGHLSAALFCMGVEAEHAAMVGDHPMDVRCGKAQGLLAIGVLTGNADRHSLEKAGAHMVVSHVREILSFLSE
ncbi:MAG: HAD family hydrolase [Deltaproteobacteria bacterium]|nr:HAD family hydrolase [Deltaproteobacteria bacterium]MBW2305517.1 HAD family hydrolase [Deltaproteobacteria bacterium]